MLFRPLSEFILCITCLDLFFCNQFISLYSLYCWGISTGEEQPNLAAHVLRHVHVEGHVSFNNTRLSIYDDSGMITYSPFGVGTWALQSPGGAVGMCSGCGVAWRPHYRASPRRCISQPAPLPHGLRRV